MAFVLTSNISIGQYNQVKVHELKIKKSIHKFVNEAIIKVPTLYRLKLNGSYVSDTAVKASDLFQEGDPVIINLGYNNRLVQEFIGFIHRVNFKTPLEIECEGYSYQLRKKSYIKTWKNTTVLEMLRYMIQGTDITLSGQIPDIPVEKWYMQNQTGVEILDEFRKKLLLTIYFRGKELYAGLTYTDTVQGSSVSYQLGWNTIRDDQLKFREAKSQQLRIIAIHKLKKGGKIQTEVGDKNAAVRTVFFPNVTDTATLKHLAEKKLSELKYDGYEGKITAFLQPFCDIAYKGIVTDPRYPQRSGNYFIDTVEVEYSTKGGRRKVEIGIKLTS
jgi:hypothetical protein